MDESTASKVCCRCKTTKPTTEFHRRSVANDGLNPACKDCLRADRRWRRALSDAERAEIARAVIERADKLCGRCGVVKPRVDFAKRSRVRDGLASWCRPCNAAYSRDHYRANRERRRVQANEWYEANKAHKNALARKWHLDNPAKSAEQHQRFLAENPDYARDYQAKRRARVKGATLGEVDYDLLPRDACGVCGEPLDHSLRYPDRLSPSLDHITPIARGGAHAQWNLQWAHLICNLRKGARIT